MWVYPTRCCPYAWMLPNLNQHATDPTTAIVDRFGTAKLHSWPVRKPSWVTTRRNRWPPAKLVPKHASDCIFHIWDRDLRTSKNDQSGKSFRTNIPAQFQIDIKSWTLSSAHFVRKCKMKWAEVAKSSSLKHSTTVLWKNSMDQLVNHQKRPLTPMNHPVTRTIYQVTSQNQHCNG